MKLKKLFVSIVCVAMCFAFGSCTLFTTGINRNGSGQSATIAGTKSVQSVEFNYNGADAGEYTHAASVYSKVAGSVVMIENSLASGGTATGAGIIVDIDVTLEGGAEDSALFILTCHHVISGSDKIRIKLLNDEKTSYDKYVFEDDVEDCLIGGDPSTDVAVLRLDITNNHFGLGYEDVTKAKICDATKPKSYDGFPVYALSPGTDVLAVGNPNSTEGWTTKGIISKLNCVEFVDPVGMMTLLGTDVSINSGNSGGGLFNMYGELIGIVNAGADSSDLENFGFAIPVVCRDAASGLDTGFLNVAKQLIENKRSGDYGFVDGRIDFGGGFSYSTSNYFAYISSVESGGALAGAGAKANDVITSFTYSGTDYLGNAKSGGGDCKQINSAYPCFAFFLAMQEINDNFMAGGNLSVSFTVERVTGGGGPFVRTTETTYTFTAASQYVYRP